MKTAQKVLALLVTFCLSVQAVPIYALDLGSSKDLNKNFDTIKVEDTNTEERTVLGEIISKRDENKKYFKMSDGSEKVNIYGSPIHFKENGKYEEVNNELISKNDIYENKKASYKVRYEKESSDDNLIELEKDGYTLTMSLNETKKVKAKISKEEKIISKEEVPNLASEVEYNNIQNGINLSYTNLPNKVKESIILNDKNASKKFEYIIKTNKKLKAEIKEHNTVVFKDNDNIIFSLETPYMYDREFNLSTDIDIKLKEINDGYELTISPSSKWLNDKNRKYPVVIDPTIITSQIRDQIDDLFIYEGDNNVDPVAKANQHILRVGSNRFSGTGTNPTRSFIRFNIPKLDTGDQIIDAKMALYSYACSLEPGISCPNGKPIEINAHKVTKDWNDNNAKWSYLGGSDSYDPRVIDYQIFNYNKNDEVKIYEFDITSIVKDWYISGKNNGLMLKENKEVKNLNREDAYFFSSDISNTYANARPVASITYRNQTGLENYQTFSTHSVGNIGVSVNNYNGNLVLSNDTLSTPGLRLPVNLTQFYNTNDKDIYLGYGKGIRFNLSQMMATDGTYIKYIDEDATRHWFKKSGNNYIDEDGLNLTLKPSGNDFIMEDKEGNKSTFIKKNSTWYLTEVNDTSGNKITIEHDPAIYNHITKVTDASGDSINFTYTNSLLTKLTDNAGREINYEYTNGNLTTITYPNGEKQTIEYNNNLVTKITAPDSS